MRLHLASTVLLLALAQGAHAQPAAGNVLDIDRENLPPGVEAPKEIAPHVPSKDDYPADSVRLQEQGSTSLRYMVLEDGTVGPVGILSPSGSQRLDDASVIWVQARHFFPAMRNGAPVRVWQHARIVWQLADPTRAPAP
jgi:TonB family protein